MCLPIFPHIIHIVNVYRKNFLKRYGYEPTIEDISVVLNIPLEKVKEIMTARRMF